MIADGWLDDARTSYDTVADAYDNLVRGRLEEQPYLLAALAFLADQVSGGPVADIGCGPGLVTRYLHERGVDVFGIDLSPGMVAVARRNNPGLRFEVGSMTDLDLADASVGGLLAFWSLIHIPDEAVPVALKEFHRVVRRGGLVLIGFHVGESSRLKTEGYGGLPMNVYVHRRTPARVSEWLREAGFTVEAELLLGPLSDAPGAVIFARRS